MIKLLQYPQTDDSETLKKKIIELQATAWPQESPSKPWPENPDTHVSSFVLVDNDLAMSHVAVVGKDIKHKDQTYKIFGLSEVVTHPSYKKSGYGLQLIKEAARFIENSEPDLSIFTCDPSIIPFYKQGGWTHIKDTCLVGGTLEKPFRSDSLGLATMIRFYSDKAVKYRHDFEGTDIYLELKENQLW